MRAEVKNVGSGVLFIIYRDDGSRLYEHLVTFEMLEKLGESNEER